MRKILLFICTLFVSYALQAQVISGCTPTSKLLKAYYRDVKILAVNRMYEIKTPDTAFITIPSRYEDTIWSGLAAISNLAGTEPSVDSVFMKYCVHHMPYAIPSYSLSLAVHIDTSKAWTKQWAVLNPVSGYTELDDLMSRYNFSIKDYYTYSFGTLATIETDSLINIKAFGDSLSQLTGVFEASPHYLIGAGSTISYTKTTDQQYTFTMAWGDCPAGCTSYVRWRYKVSSGCIVTHLSSDYYVVDPPFPVPSNCDLAPIGISELKSQSPISVFPNPANGYFTLAGSGVQGRFSYQLSDLSGRMIKEGQVISYQQVDISNIIPGWYIIKITTETGQVHVQKLHKQ